MKKKICKICPEESFKKKVSNQPRTPDIVTPSNLQQLLDRVCLQKCASKNETLQKEMTELAKSIVDLQAERYDGLDLPSDKC